MKSSSAFIASLAFSLFCVPDCPGQLLEPLHQESGLTIQFSASTTDAELKYEIAEITTPLLTREQFREILNAGSQPAGVPPAMDPIFAGGEVAPEGYRLNDGEMLIDGHVVPVAHNAVPQSNETGGEQDAEKGVTAGGQDASETSEPFAQLTQLIDEHTKLANEDKQIDEATKSHRLEVLASARSWLQKHQQFRARLAEFNAAGPLDEQRKQLEEELAGFAEPSQPETHKESTVESLTFELQNLQKQLQNSKKVLEEKNREIEELGRRITKLPELRSAAEDRLRQIKTKLTDVLDQADEETVLKKILMDSENLATVSEIDLLDEEAARQELRGKVLPLERDVESRRIKKLESEIANWENEIGRLRTKQVAEQARQARLEAINAHPALKSMAHRNEELIQLRAKVAKNIQLATQELATVTAKNDELSQVQQTLKNKLESAPALTNANGMLLVETRRNLIAPTESMMRIPKIRSELQGVSHATSQLRNERESLADPQAYIAEELSISSERNDESLIQMANEFVQTKRQFLDDLITDYETYRGLLSKVSVERKTLVSRISSIRQFIDENALWIRSADPFTVRDIQASRAGLGAFFASADWSKISQHLRIRLTRRPHEAALAACGFFALFVFTRRLK